MAKTISLTDLQTRLETLEAEVKRMGEDLVSLTHIKTELKEAKESTVAKIIKTEALPVAEIKILLANLATATEKKDKKLSFKIRRQLRKGGYSLRKENGKKEEKKAVVKTDVKLRKADKK